MTCGDETLAVLSGTMDGDTLSERLAACEAAVIMKVGRNLGKVRRAVEAALGIDHGRRHDAQLDQLIARVTEIATANRSRTLRRAASPIRRRYNGSETSRSTSGSTAMPRRPRPARVFTSSWMSISEVLGQAASAAGAKMPADFRVSITNAEGAKAYPISSFTWLLLYENPKDKAQAKTMADFVKWALTDGQQFVAPLNYAPLPKEVVTLELAALQKIKYPSRVARLVMEQTDHVLMVGEGALAQLLQDVVAILRLLPRPAGDRHQPGHFLFRDRNFFATKVGQ